MLKLTGGAFLALANSALTYGFLADPATGQSGHLSQLKWNWDPSILISLGLAAFAYAYGLRRLGKSSRLRLFGWARNAAFAAGIVTLFAALISPFDALDDQLFSAHMVQHLALLMVAPPLLIWGRPTVAWLWAFPLRVRRAIGRAWMRSGLHDAVRLLMSPVFVWILCSVALWFWHLPGPYRWALASESVHALEHICFFVTALMFWTLVIEPFGRRRLSYGAALLFVATIGLQNGLLGALLTFAGRPLYTSYLHTSSAWGLTPLEDQQLSGLIMWIPSSLIHLATLCILFIAWMRAAELHPVLPTPRIGNNRLRNAALSCALLVSLIGGLSGCVDKSSRSPWRIVDADASRGPALIRSYGCGSCHTIPGAPGATGLVGPPLQGFGKRVYIAGMLHNNPDNLVKWLRNPQSIVPGNAMPDMHVTDKDARDLAAYLYASSSR